MNIAELRQAFVAKRKELNAKQLTSFCIDTRYLLSKLIDLGTDTAEIEAARAFSTEVKQIQTDTEVGEYLNKWELV